MCDPKDPLAPAKKLLARSPVIGTPRLGFTFGRSFHELAMLINYTKNDIEQSLRDVPADTKQWGED